MQQIYKKNKVSFLKNLISFFLKRNSEHSKGFTLIELLVVIAIIGLLSSVVMVSLNSARAKARDAKKMSDLKNIQTAIYLYYDTHGYMPINATIGNEVCDGTTPVDETPIGQVYYDQLMQTLVNEKFLSSIPRTPGNGGYCYYDYGPSNPVGALVVTRLETVPNTTTGISPSCRPWTPLGNGWCNTNNNKQYCLCMPY